MEGKIAQQKNRPSHNATPDASGGVKPMPSLGGQALTLLRLSSQLKTRHPATTSTPVQRKTQENDQWKAQIRLVGQREVSVSGLHSVSNRFPCEMSCVEEEWKIDGNPVGTT